MELLKAIEATALAEIKKERSQISEVCRFWSRQLPDNGIMLDHHAPIRANLNRLVKRALILDAILKDHIQTERLKYAGNERSGY